MKVAGIEVYDFCEDCGKKKVFKIHDGGSFSAKTGERFFYVGYDCKKKIHECPLSNRCSTFINKEEAIVLRDRLEDFFANPIETGNTSLIDMISSYIGHRDDY